MTEEGVKYLEDYLQRYWARIQEAKTFIPPKYLPRYMRETKKIVVCNCDDGYLTLTYPDNGDVHIESYASKREINDVMRGHMKFVNDKGIRWPKSQMQPTIIVKSKEGEKGKASLHVTDMQLRLGIDVYRPPWLYAHILLGHEPSDILLEPEKSAENDVQTEVFAQKFGVIKSANIKETQKQVINKLEEVLTNFRAILQDASKEEDLQKFIEVNSFILSPFATEEDVFPKYKLGKEFITDFVLQNRPPTPFSHTFVEIEPASEPLFQKAKSHETELLARVNQAMDQLRNWRIWVMQNITYLKNDFPNLNQYNFILIIGRGEGLTAQQNRKLAELSSECSWRTVFTYDDLVKRLEQLIANLKQIAIPAQ